MPIAPPRPKGIPLGALRAFEAAARLGSFAKAAQELCVTAGAVAQHIKSLEIWAGAALFERRPQGVILTALGQNVCADFEQAFNQMGEAALKLRMLASSQIRIAALPSVAQLWLSPRLPAIRAQLPEVEISLTAMETLPNLKREVFDLAIFFTGSNVPESEVVDLGQDVIFPVCAPSLAARLSSPADLAHQHLLRDGTWSDDWKRWSELAMPDHRLELKGPEFSLFSLALEEAKNGAGVLIGHEALVRPLLASGELVAPFKERLPLPNHLTVTAASPPMANTAAHRLISCLAE